MPRRGYTSTNRSCARRRSASRVGVRPIPSRSIKPRSSITAPGRSSTETIMSRIAWYARSASEADSKREARKTRTCPFASATEIHYSYLSSFPSAPGRDVEEAHDGATDALVPRDRAERGVASHRRAGGRARSPGRGGRPLRTVQGQDRSVGPRPARGESGRKADRRHRDHADEGRRREDDDFRLAHAGARARGQGPGALPPGGLTRARVRDQGG